MTLEWEMQQSRDLCFRVLALISHAHLTTFAIWPQLCDTVTCPFSCFLQFFTAGIHWLSLSWYLNSEYLIIWISALLPFKICIPHHVDLIRIIFIFIGILVIFKAHMPNIIAAQIWRFAGFLLSIYSSFFYHHVSKAEYISVFSDIL